jgi:hypothetical protein
MFERTVLRSLYCGQPQRADGFLEECMNLTNEATLAVLPDRLPGESTRAYRAFRFYCE